MKIIDLSSEIKSTATLTFCRTSRIIFWSCHSKKTTLHLETMDVLIQRKKDGNKMLTTILISNIDSKNIDYFPEIKH